MKTLMLDIETNMQHDTIWCCVTQDVDTLEIQTHTAPVSLERQLHSYDAVSGHNIIGFDAPVLQSVWGINLSDKQIVDTLVLSRLYSPSRDGGHSLDSWGKQFSYPKGDFSDYDGGLTQEMIDYCVRDVELTTKLYHWLNFNLDKEGFSTYCRELEHEVAKILTQQQRTGFKLDVDAANTLYAQLCFKMNDIEQELQAIFPPIVEQRTSEKTGKALKDKVTVFNPGSRQQIAQRLTQLGVRFTKQTEKGSDIVDETVLASIDLPEAKMLNQYLLLQKRTTQIDSWLKAVQEDGRVRGRVIGCGAVTGRMTHMTPNMAQIPSVSAEYGSVCRSVWTVEAGKKLVGIDASGLELRMLAHYMGDDNYTNEVISGDIHTANQKAAGLAERHQAKTFIYAFLYGAGAAKIGSIVGGGAKEGQKMISKFLANTPALKALRESVERDSLSGVLTGLDGRKLRVRSAHSALNTLLQGAGAIVMKQALVILDRDLKRMGIPAQFVANVHDEWQIESEEWFADCVGFTGVQAIREAGVFFQMKCPLTGEFKVGSNWAETH
jgi:DNA polymerase I-like protein with 3'-5' exonuclease and polymerase domains